jgi:hypothetical protein
VSRYTVYAVPARPTLYNSIVPNYCHGNFNHAGEDVGKEEAKELSRVLGYYLVFIALDVGEIYHAQIHRLLEHLKMV